jgi:hypothetical protein
MKITVCLILADPGSCLEIGYLGGGGGACNLHFCFSKSSFLLPFSHRSLCDECQDAKMNKFL